MARREGAERGVDAGVVADVGEERAPVSGWAVLWLEAEAREVATMRCQSGMKTQCEGGRNFGRQRRQRHPFKGGDGDARGGGSSYSSTAWRRGERGSGRRWRTTGPTTTGAGGCQRRGTGEGEREGGGGGVAGMWAGSGVWGPAAGREREK
jgi:hypothetical protein